MTSRSPLERSRGLWNRSHLDLRSDEVLAQILDRGDLEDWSELYRLAAQDVALRRRILRLSATVPIATPHLFIAAMGALAEVVDPYPVVPRAERTDGI